MSAPHNLWWSFAREDLKVAEWAYQEQLYNQVCFHAQQCVEKTLKGLLLQQNITPPKTHYLVDLMQLLVPNPLGQLEPAIRRLDRFYIPTRYPDALPGMMMSGLPSKADAEEALAVARQVNALVP